MINFILGLVIGGVIAIFVYRNNKSKIGKLADKADNLYDDLTKSKQKVNNLEADKQNLQAQVILEKKEKKATLEKLSKLKEVDLKANKEITTKPKRKYTRKKK